jgi:MFS superfamily sulfate permease-like transporter
LIALTVAGLATYLLGMDAGEVRLVGTVPSGLPEFGLPGLGYKGLQTIFMDAVGLVVVIFASGMLTARSFAARNGYSVNADREMRAMGFANMASGLFGGFAVAGADSRTAVNDASGGKTQLVSVFAALTVALVALFLTQPLGHLPLPALAAVLIFSVWGLLDIVAWRELFGLSRFEFFLSLLTTVGVLTIGVLPGVVLAILLALTHVLKKIYQPREAILGWVPGLDSYNDIKIFSNAQTFPGVIIYRFEGPLLFFNADLFKSRIHELIEVAAVPPHALVLSLEAITQLDVTGLQSLRQVHDELERKGIRLLLARPKRYMDRFGQNSEAWGFMQRENLFFSIRAAVKSAVTPQQAG